MTKYIKSLTIKVRDAETKFNAAKLAWNNAGPRTRKTRDVNIDNDLYNATEELESLKIELYDAMANLHESDQYQRDYQAQVIKSQDDEETC